MTVIPFGTSPAPFLACHTLVYVAEDERGNYPRAADTVLRDFYMDDLLAPVKDEAVALERQNQLIRMLSSAHFALRK
ncbi:unnamed protein product [Allacma fusca]|uniref:Uncharacterized protein n=1 Tax=Allacma fusca TaxID=39272 RepID=A0A8J2P164_9HEXA|nr:unnamed protein product [Allacma fusca]